MQHVQNKIPSIPCAPCTTCHLAIPFPVSVPTDVSCRLAYPRFLFSLCSGSPLALLPQNLTLLSTPDLSCHPFPAWVTAGDWLGPSVPSWSLHRALSIYSHPSHENVLSQPSEVRLPSLRLSEPPQGPQMVFGLSRPHLLPLPSPPPLQPTCYP